MRCKVLEKLFIKFMIHDMLGFYRMIKGKAIPVTGPVGP
jgi:hypothetical protein